MRLPEPDQNPVRLKSLLDDVCSLYENMESPARYKIISDVDPADLTCMIDHKQIEQALINLVKNALEAIPEDREGMIELRAARDGDSVSIRIRDNGQGIPGDIIDQIFIPFFTTREKGSGIGLSLSRRIIHQHGGSISIDSEMGKGTTLYIHLPID